MKSILLHLLLAVVAVSATEAETKRPNIVLLLADDMGYGDLSCYGNKDISTPNIDKLAAEGLRLTDGHSSAAVCQPTRYAILSGRVYPRSKWGRTQSGIYFQDNEILLPQLLKDAGYSTAMFGKWHLGFGAPLGRGQDPDWNGELKPGPNECGFDYWFGMPNAHNMPPFVFVENHRVYKGDPADPIVTYTKDEAEKNEVAQRTGWGASSGGKAAHEACPREKLDLILADRASEWIKKQSADKPFFLYLPFFAPHAPYAVSEEFLRATPLSERLGKSNNNAVRLTQFIAQLDHSVGQIMSVLKEKGFDDNTLVVFTSDNGNINLGDNQAVGYHANGSLLGNKSDAWEGGHRVPVIVRWPGKVPADKTTDKLFSLTDLYDTFLAAANVPVPSGAGVDSTNMLSLLEDPDNAPGLPGMLYKGRGESVRVGDWSYHPRQGPGGLNDNLGPMVKLGQRHNDYDEAGNIKPDAPKAQLYNLREDPNQTINIIDKEPSLAAKMDELLKKFDDGVRKGENVSLVQLISQLDTETQKKLNVPNSAAQ